MERIEKTVFVSYRRTNLPWALFVYQNLTLHDYDVFFDFESIDSGDFERIIINNIKARAHFIVVLTPSALERCNNPEDWLRREIETAIEEKRNIIPLMVENFDFGSSLVKNALTGKLETLSKYSGLRVPAEFAFEAMERLRERFLNVPLQAVLHPIPREIQLAVDKQKTEVNKVAQVEIKELTAQESFEKGLQAKEFNDKINYFTDAIRYAPDFEQAYHHRGLSRYHSDDIRGAIEDYTEALRLNSNNAESHYNRGLAYSENGDLDNAILDFTEAIRLREEFAEAYLNRGIALSRKRKSDAAIGDFSRAISLDSMQAEAYYNRGLEYAKKDSLDAALQDFTQTIRLKPEFVDVYEKRASVWKAKNDLYSSGADLRKFRELGGVEEKGIYQKLFDKLTKALAELAKVMPAITISALIMICIYGLIGLGLLGILVWLVVEFFSFLRMLIR